MYADLVFRGTVATQVDSAPFTDALAVSDGRIVAVGADAVRELTGPHTERIDIGDGVLLPGFQDAHIHAVAGGLQRTTCDLSELHNLGDYRRRIVDFCSAHADAGWIRGAGWYADVFGATGPTAPELDNLVPDRPAVFDAHDKHGVWVNSAALRLARIDRHTPDPAGGVIQRDAAGEPTGVLVETAAELVTRLLPSPTAADREQALREAQRYLHSLGITAWQDALIGSALGMPDTFETYCAAADSGWLTARVVGAQWWYPSQGTEQLQLIRERRRATAHGRFTATAVKIMQDGVCENLTAAVVDAYRGHPDNHGLSLIDPAELDRIVAALHDERFDVHLHAVGDRAVRECLDALEAAGVAGSGHRHQLAHIDLIQSADIDRMRRLGVIANIQPLWAREDPVLVDAKLPYLTEQQARLHFAFETLRSAGVAIAMGSDWPVSSPDPIWGLHTAVNRTAPHADPHAQDEHSQTVPLLARERLGVADAIAAYTRGSAVANQLDQVTGTLEAGKLADLVLLDADPYEVEPDALCDIRVAATYVDGRLVHHS